MVDSIDEDLYIVQNYKPEITGMKKHAEENLKNKVDRAGMDLNTD